MKKLCLRKMMVRDVKCRICTDLDSRYMDSRFNTSFLDPTSKVEYITEKEPVSFQGSSDLRRLA